MNEENHFEKMETVENSPAADPVPADRKAEAEEIASALGRWFIRKLITYVPVFFFALGGATLLISFVEKDLDYRKNFILLSIVFVCTNFMWYICNMEAERKIKQAAARAGSSESPVKR